MLRFHLDFIHALKYLLLGCCMGIYIPWMGNACTQLWVFVCISALRGHSLTNKALAVFNFQRCQLDLRRAASWYISRATGLIVCLHFIHGYLEMYEYEFKATVKGLTLPSSNGNGQLPDYIHKQRVTCYAQCGVISTGVTSIAGSQWKRCNDLMVTCSSFVLG